MTELIAIILAVGTILPLLISVVQQPHWSARTRTIISLVVSGIAGLVTYVTQFGLDLSSPSAIVTAVIGVIMAANVAYRNVWKPTGISGAIESKTSGGEVAPSGEVVDADVADEDGNIVAVDEPFDDVEDLGDHGLVIDDSLSLDGLDSELKI